jgi:hypothetical protein
MAFPYHAKGCGFESAESNNFFSSKSDIGMNSDVNIRTLPILE